MASLNKDDLKKVFDRFHKIADTKDVAPPKSISKVRLQVMVDNTLDPPQEALEKIRGQNNLTSVATLLRGFEVGLSVGLVYDKRKNDVDNRAVGSGFMIAPNLFLTNNHVIGNKEEASRYGLMMNYQRDLDGNIDPVYKYDFRPESGFYTNEDLDFTVVAVGLEEIENQGRLLNSFGYLKLLEEKGKIAKGEFAGLIEHPNGKPKQIVLFESEILYDKNKDFLLYSTDSDEGASGSPVFNYEWVVVALHHAGVPASIEKLNEIDGDLVGESDFPRAANEGIRISSIMAKLKTQAPDLYTLINDAAKVPLLNSLPINPFRDARTIDSRSVTERNPQSFESLKEKNIAKSEEFINTPIDLSKNETILMNNQPNVIHVNIPLEIRLGTTQFSVPEKTIITEGLERRSLEGSVNNNLNNRSGYDADFLDNLSLKIKDIYKPYADKGALAPTEDSSFELHYTHFSVAMHKVRKMALITAVNIDGNQSTSIPRGNDNWRFDGRMDTKYQLGNGVYANNDLDRGHMVRREDPNWGREASIANDDTFHFTNSCPQHKDLNQKTWLSVEDYVLKNTKTNNLKVSVFTGPILDENYVHYREALVPVQFYKVVAMIKKDGTPSITGYVLTQKELISGLEKVQTEFVFGKFKTYQIALEKIEEMTGLDFSLLKPHDPLKGALESVPREITDENDVRV